jgi:hypothetical protein
MTEEVIKVTELVLTSHALVRMYARRFSEEAIWAAFQHGREVHGRGAVIFAIGRKEVMRGRTLGVDLTGYEGIHVVCSREGTIMTVYRNHDLRDLRPRKRSRSYRYRLTIEERETMRSALAYQSILDQSVAESEQEPRSDLGNWFTTEIHQVGAKCRIKGRVHHRTSAYRKC